MPSVTTKAKGGKLAGKLGAKATSAFAPHAGKAAWKLGKAEAKLIRAAMSGREPRSSRYLKYAMFLAVGLALGAVVRSAKKPPKPPHHEPHREPNIGAHGGGVVARDMIPEDQEQLAQKIRTLIGEHDHTKGMPRPNVTVTDGVAELRGPVSSEAEKSAAAEIAASVEGVREVRNLLVIT